MKKQKTPATGAQYAGTPPIQHSGVVLAQAEQPAPSLEEKSTHVINADDIEADRHNGSGGAFEATEGVLDEE